MNEAHLIQLLTPETVDAYLDNMTLPLRAILFTRRDAVPELWQVCVYI